MVTLKVRAAVAVQVAQRFGHQTDEETVCQEVRVLDEVSHNQQKVRAHEEEAMKATVAAMTSQK